MCIGRASRTILIINLEGRKWCILKVPVGIHTGHPALLHQDDFTGCDHSHATWQLQFLERLHQQNAIRECWLLGVGLLHQGIVIRALYMSWTQVRPVASWARLYMSCFR